MPVQKLSKNTLEQYCALCRQANTVKLTSLELGVSGAGGTRANKDIILLPPCPTCGAREQLVRLWNQPADDVPDTHQRQHRRLVNRLGAMLKHVGRIDPGCVDDIAGEPNDPPDIHPTKPKGKASVIDIGPPAWAATDNKRSK